MIIKKWTDGNGNKNFTVTYAGKSRTFQNEEDANAYRTEIENAILNLNKGGYSYGRLGKRNYEVRQ